MTPRRVPGRPGTCARCGAPIVWGRTRASETGPGGKAMPLDPVEDPAGNVAVCGMLGEVSVARVLRKDEHPIRDVEVLTKAHFATCTPPPAAPELPANVIPFPRHPRTGIR